MVGGPTISEGLTLGSELAFLFGLPASAQAAPRPVKSRGFHSA